MNDSLQFILAGNALFTVENVATGNRFTFKVRQPDDDKPHFVSVLTGPDNEHDYAFLGTVFDAARYHHGRRSRIPEDAPSAKAFEWLFRQLSTGHSLPPQVRATPRKLRASTGGGPSSPASLDGFDAFGAEPRLHGLGDRQRLSAPSSPISARCSAV